MTKNTKDGIFAIVIAGAVLLSCMPGSVLVETNYEIDQLLTASVGSEMVVIEKVRETSEGSRFMQAMGNQPVISTVNFIATLTYTGKSGSTIKVAYREFSGVNNRANAQPAFYLPDLEYTLEEEGPTIITYRDIQIEVIDATSSQIQFKVISDEGLNWLPNID